MKAKVLKPFTMGVNYVVGQVVDLEDWRVKRLVGEGLVEAIEDSLPVSAPEAPKVSKPEAAKTAKVKDTKAQKAGRIKK